jgi:hypothetical protein
MRRAGIFGLFDEGFVHASTLVRKIHRLSECSTPRSTLSPERKRGKLAGLHRTADQFSNMTQNFVLGRAAWGEAPE